MPRVYDEELNVDVHFDPATEDLDWRYLPGLEYDDLENDEDHPTPQYVIDLLGFDPDELDEEPVENAGPNGGLTANRLDLLRAAASRLTDNAFCPTGKGGGIKNTCSSKKSYQSPESV